MRFRLVPAVLLGLALVAGMSTPTRAGETGPTATLSAGSGDPGETLAVRGEGWPAGAMVQVQLCGNNALDGSIDCALPQSVTIATGPDGRFGTDLVVVEPPSPCPCVVNITSIDESTEINLPFEVNGAEVATVSTSAPTLGQLRVLSARLEGEGPWASWFGGGAERTLVLTLENNGSVAVEDPPIALVAGRGSAPKASVDEPSLGILEPGEKRAYRIPVDFGAPAFGGYTVQGEVTGLDTPADFRAQTSAYPWGLATVAGLLLAGLVFLAVRSRKRRRRDATPAPQARRPAQDELSADEFEQVLGDLLADTLAALSAELGDRPLSEDVAARLAQELAADLTDQVSDRFALDQAQLTVLETSLRDELSRALSRNHGLQARQGLATVGTPT